jgi:hypothetical protein
MSFGALMAALPLPPALALARQTTSFTAGLNGLLASKSGGDLYRMNREILRGLGLPDSQSEPFLDNPNASPRHKTFTVAAVRDLAGVAGFERFIARGRELASEAEALRLQRSAELARGVHLHVSPLREVVREGDELLLAAKDGGLVAALPADRLLWTQASAALADAMAARAAADPALDSLALWVTGRLSERARDELVERGFALHEQASERLEPVEGG